MAGWDESKHSREKDGKFSSGGGGSVQVNSGKLRTTVTVAGVPLVGWSTNKGRRVNAAARSLGKSIGSEMRAKHGGTSNR